MNNTYTWLQDDQGRPCIAQNKIYNGEAWGHKSLVGLRHFPHAAVADEEWWMRNVDGTKQRSSGEIYVHKPHAFPTKENFHVERPSKDHSRRVFGRLAGIKHSYSDGNFHTLREEPKARRHMAQRYAEVLKRPAHQGDTEGSSPSKSAASRSLKASQQATFSKTAPAGGGGSGAAEGEEETWEQRMTAKIKKQPKWGNSISCPKSETRVMGTGRRLVVIPNPRLQVERVPADIHGHTPPRYARAKRVATLNYDGECYHMEA